ncbi:hypothetical protein RHSIM_Rhsim02G0218600 [Rhododendron simsii]|uniref:Xylanase inhibitor N-terminal domain-containing protein n=1 Tax=Rhododendron simsii TaxID=118357 RepID=A0A834LTA3_RHOSS|nr:hypothetical protein RHSIM_Rhsim02G0218600 [Rhododendron simsii]
MLPTHLRHRSLTDCSTATCAYGIQNGGDIEGDSSSVGFLGYEKLTITPSDVFPNFIFGCSRNNQNPFYAAAGLLGLSRDPLSAVSQTASKYGNYFSYCLLANTDEHRNPNFRRI